MFPKPAFGGNTSGFGSFTSTPSTSFGAFKSTPGTGAFGGSSAFGASTSTQPTTGGGLFGASTSSGGLFGSTQAPAATSGFGATTGGFGFGANTSSGGLFSNNQSSGGLFGNTQNNSTFGAKPAGGFGFGGATTNTSGLFGTSSTPGTGLFGQQNNTLGGGSLFSNTTAGGFGQQTASGTGHVKYNAVVGTDVVVKSGTSQNINTKHHCITCMKEYEGKSLEELRLEDYTAGRKGSSGGMFGGFQQQPENKPLFGGSTFGQPATTSAPSMFGSGPLAGSSGFGQTNAFSFGNATQNPSTSTSLFGANKTPFGTTTPATGLFGATTTQNSTFGTNTSTFGFGGNTQTQPGGLFAPKPATSAFGTTPSTGFGGFSTGTTLFGAKPQQTTAPTFGTATPGAFGGFGTNTSTASNPFGTSFGTTTVQPLQPNFGFGANKPTLGTGLGTGLVNNSFQAKPPGSTSFGPLGGGLFAQTPAQNNTFKTGLDSGLGGGLFNNTSTLGATQLGGFNTTNTGLNNSGTGVAGSNVHEQILTLAARPYGDSPLFKDLLPDSKTTADEVLKPTNPGAVKGVLEASGAYRVTSPSGPRLKLMPRVAPMTTDKKSLFDGLEESDSTLEDRLSLKPSKKRLVLRTSNSKANDSAELNNNRRSLDATEVDVHNEETRNGRRTSDGAETGRQLAEASRQLAEVSRNSADYHHNSNSIDNASADYSTWLNVERERLNEKPIDDQTPRIYPNLDKEMAMSPVSERRASWLTTKPLRKSVASNADATERIVRDSNVGSERNVSYDNKENIDIAPVSEEEQVVGRGEVSAHPAGVKLSRPGYYTVPSLDEMIGYMRPDGSCVLPHLTIGRHNYGNVYFDEPIDVAGLDLDELVHFRNREVVVYPDESVKPPEGVGLNRRAIVTLDRVWPRDKTERRPITQPDRLMLMDFEGRLRRVCNKYETKFIEYRPQTGSWVFRVDHFSKYGFSDSDEEDDDVPDILKRQLVNQALQQAAPIKTAPKPPAVATGSGLGGVGPALGGSGPGLGGSGALSELSALSTEDNVYTMHHTSLNLLNGGSKVFEMDTTEENAEIPSLYTETSRSIGVKSPTSELARLENRQSHNVQLMKASLYADTEMDDDMSASTGDQLVPQPSCLIMPAAATLTPSIQYNIQSEPMEDTPAVITEEIQMKPLMVRPMTVVLNYHRKVPPFKQTIAGRLDAACLADMSVCRARHSRIGFGPAGALAFSTTYFSINELPKHAELPDLPLYVRGRSDTDWSEPVVAMIALGRHSRNNNITDTLKNYLAELLEYSERSTVVAADALTVPRLSVKSSPADRLKLLQKYVDLSADVKTTSAFGVSGVYWQQVWRLCEALWGADLKNDGVPGTDEESIVNRHKRLLEWLKDAVADVTDAELSQPVHAEKEDDKDGHSVRVWTLLLAGRVLEACKLSREMGDLNMATLIAQSQGDPIFRELIEHQLSKWRESGAIDLISSYKVAVLQLLAGSSIPPTQLSEVGWLRALSVAARYICPQVPSLEQIVRTYEGFFAKDLPQSDDALDLTAVEPDCASAPLPLPPHCKHYDCTSANNNRRILDLRYCLLRARAFNTRPRLRTGSYTPDPLDYTLCFLLGTWFGNPSVESVTGIADQLEANGDWHLAIQALAYHPDDNARNYLIQRLLSRLVPSRPATPEMRSRLELVRRLAVPEKWIRRAQAHRAKYEHLPALEAEHLAAAGDWNAAHEVLLEHLLPQAVFNGTLFGNSVCATENLKSISALLEQLNSAAERHEVSGWEKGGQALYRYMHICQEVCGVSERSEGGEARDALWSRVLAACRALAALQPGSRRVVVARAEMGSQLVELLMKAGTPPHQLAEVMRTLRLPLDATATARYKITAELAEQASELCIESAQSSPLSSRHRAIVGT